MEDGQPVINNLAAPNMLAEAVSGDQTRGWGILSCTNLADNKSHECMCRVQQACSPKKAVH
jgi:hypothetical protein